MKKFINHMLAPLLAFAIAFVPMGSASATPRGTQFYVGAENPAELKRVILASLATDPTGNTKVRPEDPGDRAYGTPNDWLVMLQEADPRAREQLRTAADLPAYLDSLVEADAPEGRYWSACITPRGPVLRCELRAFRPGEKAWVNPRTAMTVFMQGCTNPIGGKERDDCYVVEFDYRERRETRWTQYGGNNYAAVSVHMSLTEEQFRRMYADSCYFVEDGNGRRKPEPDCPALYCPPGSQWPQVALASAVGLPTERPPTSIHTQLLDGRGRLSLPRSILGQLTLFVPCVVTNAYPVGVEGYRRYMAVARFDRVQITEFRETRVSGRLGRVLTGSLHY